MCYYALEQLLQDAHGKRDENSTAHVLQSFVKQG